LAGRAEAVELDGNDAAWSTTGELATAGIGAGWVLIGAGAGLMMAAGALATCAGTAGADALGAGAATVVVIAGVAAAGTIV
jgi:hypothetical protein